MPANRENKPKPNRDLEFMNKQQRAMDLAPVGVINLNIDAKHMLCHYRAKQSETKKSNFKWTIKIKNNPKASNCLNEWLTNNSWEAKNNLMNYDKSINGISGLFLFWSKNRNKIWFNVLLQPYFWQLIDNGNWHTAIEVRSFIELISFNGSNYFLNVVANEKTITYGLTNPINKESINNDDTIAILNILKKTNKINHNLGFCPISLFFNKSLFRAESDFHNETRFGLLDEYYKGINADLQTTRPHIFLLGSMAQTETNKTIIEQYIRDVFVNISQFSSSTGAPIIPFNPNSQVDKISPALFQLQKDIIAKSFGWKDVEHKGTVQQTNSQTANQNDEADNNMLLQMDQQKIDLKYFIWKVVQICQKLEINLDEKNVNWNSINLYDIEANYDFAEAKVQMLEQIAIANNPQLKLNQNNDTNNLLNSLSNNNDDNKNDDDKD